MCQIPKITTKHFTRNVVIARCQLALPLLLVLILESTNLSKILIF